MVENIHDILRRMLRERGKIGALDADIDFEAPQKEWVASLTRPAINVFLFDVKENTEKRETNPQTIRASGKSERRMPPRRIDSSYMVSVFASEIQDEHTLLWRVTATLMKYSEFPEEILPQEMKEELSRLDTTITARLSDKDSGRDLIELWNALGTPPHPALHYIVTAPLDLDYAISAPLVLARKIRYGQIAGEEENAVKGVHRVGEIEVVGRKSNNGIDRDTYFDKGKMDGVVLNAKGSPLAGVTVSRDDDDTRSRITDKHGRFELDGVPAGVVTLVIKRGDRILKRVEITVPDRAYEIVMEE